MEGRTPVDDTLPDRGNLIIVPRAARSKELSLAQHSSRRIFWSRVDPCNDTAMDGEDMEELCRSCPICQKACPELEAKAPVHSLPICNQPFQRMAMDVFVPLRRTKARNKYILVIIDYLTKWPKAYPLKNATANAVVECLADSARV